MFVEGPRKTYDWQAISDFYEAGNSPSECQARFDVFDGAWYAAVRRGQIVLRETRGRPRTETREQVARLSAEGLSQAAIARELGVSKPTVCFHMRKLGIPARSELARRYDWGEVREYYEEGHSAAECRKRFGFSRNAWADAVRRRSIELRPAVEPIEAVLAAGRRRNRNHVKARLFMAGLKHRCCEICGLSEWQDRPIGLELHHVNGDGLDNRLENLLLLCPNCHSQTDTWGGRNKARRATG